MFSDSTSGLQSGDNLQPSEQTGSKTPAPQDEEFRFVAINGSVTKFTRVHVAAKLTADELSRFCEAYLSREREREANEAANPDWS